ncbi:ParB/RepB/Spo0J family partition protein [Porticoccaceae bacterium]|nr:ParB/RepB/Spo0J family partition protein [Porticoccaceae bacterium]MDA8681061.1 ParB/RepB/Spo0J family partition protein [Porticoccaceae bacterium]MDB2344020.1 ParB/RepB/Spo0J family partition protein [Porticoccaceae bacterium]MDB2635354.1 ParB/RepB/Spo0J family partition protein [Porticoccaceae bacterium]
MNAKRQSLGKGLDALLNFSDDQNASELQEMVGDGVLRDLPVEFLQRGKYQPRRDIDMDALSELASSISQQGVMQPIVVRKVAKDKYEIIAGERRWRATQKAGLATIPAIIRELTDEAAIAMALIENIQREDLNAIEESRALLRLQDEFGLTQQQVADAVGKSRSAVTNLMRLASLEEPVQTQLELGEIDLGHAKCLLALEGTQQISAGREIAANALSVRQTETLVKQMKNASLNKIQKVNVRVDADILRMQESLSERLGAEVSIQHKTNGGGKLVFKYHCLDELEGILSRIK